MLPRVLALCALLAACGRPHPHTVPAPASNPTPATSRQLLVVTSASWDSVPATLARFERDGPHAQWRPVGAPVPVVLGRTGLAWGVGLHDPSRERGPVKYEGDGRSPAGMFRLGSAFGFGPADTIGPLRVPYRQLTSATDCVDDQASSHYNTLAERDAGPHVEWKSGEHMLAIDPDYRYGIFVDHNTAPRTPGRGSCIFIHIWEGPTKPTAGCTALDAQQLADLLRWLDTTADPILVQLPRPEYDRLRPAWSLPTLP
jgi:L,D-peptidoglycan transpeptidase YkuD (ErfK/YbiS/YcfS/YnhG family)